MSANGWTILTLTKTILAKGDIETWRALLEKGKHTYMEYIRREKETKKDRINNFETQFVCASNKIGCLKCFYVDLELRICLSISDMACLLNETPKTNVFYQKGAWYEKSRTRLMSKFGFVICLSRGIWQWLTIQNWKQHVLMLRVKNSIQNRHETIVCV